MGAEEFKEKWLPLSDRFYRVAYYILESTQDAEDAVQDLFTRLWKIRATLSSVSNPASYGITIIRNICLDRLRSSAVTKVIKSTDEAMEAKMDPFMDLDRDIANKEDLGLIRSCMARLPATQRRILEMRVMENLSYSEIAKLNGITEVNARVLLSNARKNLKTMMENEKCR